MRLDVRKLNADEIRVKPGKVNNGGVSLLLWKDGLCDYKILEESLESDMFQITYPDPGRCRISIWDTEKNCWVSKEGIGEGSSPKTLAGDALKRAGTAWGIGRELYTAGDMFIFKDKLKGWKTEKNDEGKDVAVCFDTFKVEEIRYDNDHISFIRIGIYQYGKKHGEETFCFTDRQTAPQQEPASKATKETKKDKPQNESPQNNPNSKSLNQNPIHDDEVILIGNCKGKKYGDVKDTPTFKSFLKWTRTATTSYQNPDCADQLARFKMLAEKSA